MVEHCVLDLARSEQASDPFAFRFSPQTYLLRTAGGGVETGELAWTQELLSQLAAIRRPDRDPAVVQQVGKTLQRFLTQLGWAEYEARILQASSAGKKVILTFRSAAAELYALPWELVTFKASGQHLGGIPNLLLRYEWPETRTTPESSSPRREEGRILFAWSAAGGAVPAKEHTQALSAACQAAGLAFNADGDILSHVSCERLVATLERARAQGQSVSVLHLLCHGGQSGSAFGLVLDGEAPTGGGVTVDAGRLRQLLGPYSDMIRLVVLSACDSGNSGAMGNQLGSVAQALHRAGFAAVVASRYPLAVSASIRLTEVLYSELLVESRSLEDALRIARERLARDASHLDWASLQLYSRSADGEDSRPVVFRPFRGLLAFQPRHSHFFFGREREIDEVSSALSALEKNQRPRFLVVAGASGSGKSSLVLAGVVPRLLAAAGGKLRLAVMRPGSEPQKALDSALSAASGSEDGAGTLLVVDQFEEVFTHVPDAAVREAFVRRLWSLAQGADGKVQVLVTLRVDFLGECGSIMIDQTGRRLDSVTYAQEHRVFVAWLAADKLRAAIEGPVERVGIDLEAGLTGRMLEAVGAEPGALPLLSYTLDMLWLRREGRVLTQSGYEAVGQVAGALSGHADALLAKMSGGEQLLAHRLFVRLVHLGDGVANNSRQRVPVSRLRPEKEAESADFDRVVNSLVDARLVLRGEEGHEQTLEVAHEALIRSWPQLHRWLQEDRSLLDKLERLEAMLVQWRKYKATLTGEQLQFAEQLAREQPADFPEEARALLLRSQRTASKYRWLQRGLLFAIISAVPILVAVATSEWLANSRAAVAKERLINLITLQSQRNPSAEMLRTLAWVHLTLDLRSDLALQTIDKAVALEPENPHLLADRAEYLMAASQFDAVNQVAKHALALQTDPEARLRVAVIGWSAARVLGPPARALQAEWAPLVEQEYDRMPLGARLTNMLATTEQLVARHPQMHAAAAKLHVLPVLGLLYTEKTEGKKQELAKLLQPEP